MITLLTAVGSLILALISVISYLWTKNRNQATLNQNQGVKDQINTIDATIAGNQAQITQEQQNLANKEKGETNDSILSSINSNAPKS